MGLRCDFCNGSVLIANSSVAPKPGTMHFTLYNIPSHALTSVLVHLHLHTAVGPSSWTSLITLANQQCGDNSARDASWHAAKKSVSNTCSVAVDVYIRHEPQHVDHSRRHPLYASHGQRHAPRHPRQSHWSTRHYHHQYLRSSSSSLLSSSLSSLLSLPLHRDIICSLSCSAVIGDDCFNVHGNFFVLADAHLSPHKVSYIDETGPGWIPGSPARMVGDVVAFYSRQTLQQLGPDNRIVSATAGFGAENATITLAQPVPAAVKNYDMLISKTRVASFQASGCLFEPGGRGMVISAWGVRITNNTFRNLHKASILFLEGGCGAYEDYTEGPFSRDIYIADNHFDRSYIDRVEATQGEALVQLGSCVPLGVCPAGPAERGRQEARKRRALKQGPDSSQAFLSSGASTNTTTLGSDATARDSKEHGHAAGEPYPLPACTPGGSTVPPIVTHSGDTGPGRITEPGQELHGGLFIYSNVTLESNTFEMADSGAPHFIDIGNTQHIVIRENRMTLLQSQKQPREVGTFLSDIHIYSSQGYDTSTIIRENTCRPNACNVTTEHNSTVGT